MRYHRGTQLFHDQKTWQKTTLTSHPGTCRSSGWFVVLAASSSHQEQSTLPVNVSTILPFGPCLFAKSTTVENHPFGKLLVTSWNYLKIGEKFDSNQEVAAVWVSLLNQTANLKIFVDSLVHSLAQLIEPNRDVIAHHFEPHSYRTISVCFTWWLDD